MNKNQLIGSFYFRKTPNGNLIGEFTNNRLDIIQSESCDIISQVADTVTDFAGQYRTSWRQGDEVFQLRLEIRRTITQDLKFNLIWRNEARDIVYSGQGFMAENQLTGFYVPEEFPNLRF